MKVAVTSTGSTLEDQVAARFGRCPYFLVVDTDSMQFEVVENPNLALGGGAGIQSAQMMAEKGVSHILTGNCGPNAFQVFGRAGVEVIVGVAGPAREALERFKTGEFSSANAANVQSHFGIGLGEPQGQAPAAGPDGSAISVPRMGMRPGGGKGGGRGMGCGRVTGRGKGMSSGMGGNQWTGQRGFEGMSTAGARFHSRRRAPAPADEQIGRSTRQEHPKSTRGAMRAGRKAAAWVEAQSCAGCGICVDVCPVGAIRMEEHAVVDPTLCTACATCVSECPNEAIIIMQQRFP